MGNLDGFFEKPIEKAETKQDLEWVSMPEYINKDITSFHHIKVHFKSQKELDEFAKLINQPVTTTTKSIWFPFAVINRYATKRYADEKKEEKSEF